MDFHLANDYKKLGFSKGLMSLWSGKALLDFGSNIFLLFFPILLYQNFHSYNAVILYFLFGSLIYFVTAPLGAKLMSMIGTKKSLIISNIFRVPYFLAWYKFPDDPLFYAILAAISITLIRNTFWLPFHVDSAEFSSKKDRGKQFGLIFSIGSILTIIAPVLGGFIIDKSGDFELLVTLSLIISILSAIPFYFLPDNNEQVSWTYFETYKYFFHPYNRRMVLAYMADGAVGVINSTFWPLFIFTLMDEQFKEIGILSGAIILAGLILRLFIGNLLDKFNKVKLVRIGAVLNSMGWIFKMAVVSALQIFFVSLYHTLAVIILRTSLDTLVYEKAADRGHYIDEYTLIKEMAMHLGRVAALILGLILLIIFNGSLQVTFILAALAAFFVTLLR